MPLAFPPLGTRAVATAGLTIAASMWRWDGNSGAGKVSGGVAMLPGYCTAANLNTYRVFVGGVEQAVAVRALDGTFPDGSYRSILTQYDTTLTHNLPVAVEIRLNQGPRGTTDIAYVEPTLAAIVSKRMVIAPTDPTYLCGTCVTLAPLTPATNDTGTDATWAAAAVSDWALPGLATGAGTTSGGPGNALYDHVTGLFAMYCRTGDRSYYQWAYDWAIEGMTSTIISSVGAARATHTIMPYVLPLTQSPVDFCAGNSVYNPEGIPGTNDCGGFIAENLSLRASSMASAYWMTGWRQFKRSLAKQVNYALAWTNTGYPDARDKWVNDAWGHRYNFGGTGLLYVVVGYLVGCTTEFAQAGLGAPAMIDYETHLPWILDALEYHIWNLPGDYRNGLVGQRSITDSRTDLGRHNDYSEYGITNFQLTIVTEFLMLYYDWVKPDARIPGWIKTILDYQIGQSRLAIGPGNGPDDQIPPYTQDLGYPGQYVSTYKNSPLPLPVKELFIVNSYPTTTTVYYKPWWLHMFPPAFAWYAAYSGDATYATWATRASDTRNRAMTGVKNWGEYYGGTRQAFLYYRHGGTIRGTPGVHPTVITNPPNQTVP